MSKRQEISTELQQLNSTLSVGVPSLYAVPSGYFEGLAASVLQKIKIQEELQELSPLVAGVSKEMPYSVPQFYFDENIDILPALISEDEQSFVLDAIGKEMPYDVPVGYFGGVENGVLDKISTPSAKVVPIGRRWMKMAVAAAITGIIAFSGYNYLFNNTTELTANNTENVSQTAALQKEPVVADLKKVTEKELDAFIANVEIPRKPQVTENNKSQKEQLKEELKAVPVSELENFLEAIPTADDELPVID